MKTSLEQTAFNDELLNIIGTDKIGWSSENHLTLATNLLNRLQNEKGDKLQFSESQKDRLDLIFKPSEEKQFKVLKQVFAESDFEMDANSEKAFKLLLSVAQLADFLSKTLNPKTGMPFVRLEKKRGRKKEAFTSLIAAPATISGEAATGDANVEQTEEDMSQAEEPKKMVTKPKK